LFCFGFANALRSCFCSIEILRAMLADPAPEFPVASGAKGAPRVASKSMRIEEFADQWALLEWQAVNAVRPRELLRQSWTSPQREERAPNVVRYLAWFNNARAWAAGEVCCANRFLVSVWEFGFNRLLLGAARHNAVGASGGAA
jgi:hypothetical protein